MRIHCDGGEGGVFPSVLRGNFGQARANDSMLRSKPPNTRKVLYPYFISAQAAGLLRFFATLGLVGSPGNPFASCDGTLPTIRILHIPALA